MTAAIKAYSTDGISTHTTMTTFTRLACVLAVTLLPLLLDAAEFGIDYERDTFVMDGQPFRYVSGSVHYFRLPRPYWRDRLRKLKAAGLNVVTTYVEWSQHEPSPGVYNFEGDLNITDFVLTAKEEGLYTILRVGPYICAEREMGGFPAWILKNQPDIYLRSKDTRFTGPVEKWLNVFLPHIDPLLYGNGGPVIMVQVENEFGFYVSCDKEYTAWLRDVFQRHVQNKAVLFTTDGGGALGCGKIDGVYATVDFGPGTNVNDAFNAQRQYEPHGPLVDSEFYPGWLTHWGEGMAHRDTADVVKTLEEILQAGGNVNFYMFYGGTNFGFYAGANGGGEDYQSDITSYDYEAPITEAGDLTDKYEAIKNVVFKYLPPTNVSVATADKGDYGTVSLNATAGFLTLKMRNTLGSFNQATYPQSFETLDQKFGYMAYDTILPSSSNQELNLGVFHDYANVYLNNEYLGTLSREFKTKTLTINSTSAGDKLTIVVENLGRINFGGDNNDSKGLLSNVTFGGQVLMNWNMTSYELDNVKPVEDCVASRDCLGQNSGFRFYVGTFQIDAKYAQFEFEGKKYPLESYLDMSGFQKGLVYVNGFNLGRYWSTRKPQKTLYVPGVYLRAAPDINTLIVMDELITNTSISIPFRTTPILEP